jgi:hypothetical protein
VAGARPLRACGQVRVACVYTSARSGCVVGFPLVRHCLWRARFSTRSPYCCTALRRSTCSILVLSLWLLCLVTTPTGDQVLDSLSFNDSLGWSIFGLCIMIIGLILLGVLMLHFNKLHYLDMGHVGSRKVKLTPSVAEAEDNITAAAAALDGSAETAVVKGAKAVTATADSEAVDESTTS